MHSHPDTVRFVVHTEGFPATVDLAHRNPREGILLGTIPATLGTFHINSAVSMNLFSNFLLRRKAPQASCKISAPCCRLHFHRDINEVSARHGATRI